MPRARAVLCLCALLTACGSRTAGGSAPRNLLFVVFDTTRADHLSAYGHPVETTPVVDGIARRGARFESAYAQSSLTPVSAGSFFTGLYPNRHGIRSLFDVAAETLAGGVTTLAQHLEEADLATAGFVSAVPMSARYGLDRGFATWSDKLGPRAKAPCGNEYQRRADETAELALAWLDGNGSDPFFLFVHFFDAHDANLVPPRDFLTPRVSFRLPANLDEPCALMGLPAAQKLELYDAEIAFMDREVGRLCERLERLGVLDETLVVVIADHGEGLGEHGNWTHGWLHEEQLRVPLVLAGPGIPAGTLVRERIRLVDLFPTLLALFGVAPVPDRDGASLLGLLHGAPETPRDVYAEVHHALEDRLRRDPAMFSLAHGPWKYIHRPESGAHELYDLAADPRELDNLYALDHPMVSVLFGELERRGVLGGRTYSERELSDEHRAALEVLGYLGEDDAPTEPGEPGREPAPGEPDEER